MAEGDVLWQASPSSYPFQCPPEVLTNHVLIGDRQGGFWKLDKADGSVVESHTFGKGIEEGIAVTSNERYAYIPASTDPNDSSPETTLYKWDIENWAEVWSVTYGEVTDSVPAVDPNDGSVYLVLANATIRAYTSSGSFRWEAGFSGSADSLGSKVAINKNGKLVTGVGSEVATIQRDGSSGQSYDTGANVEAAPIIDRNTQNVFVGSFNGTFYKFDQDMNLLASNNVASSIASTAAFSQDLERVAFGTDDSEDLVILDKSDLSVVATRSDDSTSQKSHVTTDTGSRFVYLDGGGDVRVVDDRDASLAVSVSTSGGNPEAGPTLEPGAIYAPTGDGTLYKVESSEDPVSTRGQMFNLPYYHPEHHNFGTAAAVSDLVVMLSDSVGLRGGKIEPGEQAVLYADSIARVEKDPVATDTVALSSLDLGQS